MMHQIIKLRSRQCILSGSLLRHKSGEPPPSFLTTPQTSSSLCLLVINNHERAMARFHGLLLILALALASLSNAHGYYGSHSQLHPSDCGARCSYRCSATHHRKPCMFFCQKCCATCLCVPPGTYGNREYCPCYNNWKTQEGRPKCP